MSTNLELSPGFFDPRIALSDDDDDILPQNINVEEMNEENEGNEENDIVKTVMFWFVVQKPCGCNGGWSRTKTY